jgi:transglutaminase-like putative cysteine protease
MHLAEALATADRTGSPEVLPVRQKVRYRLTVKPDTVTAGSRVRCWLPFPQVWHRQRDVQLIATCPEAHHVAPPATEGDPPGGAAQRTVFFEQRVAQASEPIVFEAEYSFVNTAYCPEPTDDQARPSTGCCCQGWLGERLPHIVFTDELKRTVDALSVGVPNPLTRARKIFEWIVGNIRYCAEQEYATIPSFTRWALERGRGDCGVQAMLFIAMCRCAGIPARWQSGWVTFPGLIDMHDWAEFYVAPWGWLPADVSYGLMTSDDPRVRNYFFGGIDAYRMIVNVDYGAALDPPKESLRSEPADFQRGEVEADGRNLYFNEWNYAFTSSVEAIDQEVERE